MALICSLRKKILSTAISQLSRRISFGAGAEGEDFKLVEFAFSLGLPVVGKSFKRVLTITSSCLTSASSFVALASIL